MNGFVKSGLTLALTLCACGTAYAHAHLFQSTPAADAVVTAAPDVLRLDFSEGIQLGFRGVALHGPAEASLLAGTRSLHQRLAAFMTNPAGSAIVNATADPANRQRSRNLGAALSGHCPRTCDEIRSGRPGANPVMVD
jgi:methionine-rich copper-binding protein CopC